MLAAVVLLARRLKAAIPDAKHPGKAGEESQGESELSPRDFPRLSWARSPQTFVSPCNRQKLSAFPKEALSPGGVQRPKAFGRGVGAESPQRLLHAKFQAIIEA
jgi:hypothetical protein